MPVVLTHFAGRAGDHSDRAMAASPVLTAVLAERLAVEPIVIGERRPVEPSPWDEALVVAAPAFAELAGHFDRLFRAGASPVTALSRCAVALATLPVVVRHRPDAVVVWFDAHADLNTPQTTTTGFLGGLALSGPVGLWDSGWGAGLALTDVILVGARDLDPAEQRLVDGGSVTLVPVGSDMDDDLGRAIAGRPVYVHIDCDVLEPGTVPTDYRVPGGMTLAQLSACARAIARSEVVGVQIAELEADAADPGSSRPAGAITDALEPVLQALS
ncbi:MULTISPECIES: arginase family protein [Microbacterium]|nr:MULTISPECIES: arginase family protein [Microbacterium]MCK6065966.1 arginase family protein [Microbacterium sp. EYE_512]